MRAAAFQFDVRRGDVAANLASVERGLASAAERGIELVVLPEMWPTSFVAEGDAEEWQRETDAALARVQELSRELGLVVAGSAFGRSAGLQPGPGTAALQRGPGPAGLQPGAPRAPRNRLTVFARGERVLVYDKLHLFSPTAEAESFSAGDALAPTVRTHLGRLAGIVCYDLRFGMALRAPHLDGAEILVVPAQWPATRAVHWRALVCGRAAELQAFVVAANRTGTDLVGRRRLELTFAGNSLIAGPDGAVLAEGRGQEGLVEAELDLADVRALRRVVPVREDERRDVYGPR
jgi:predicted amidohydrolase